MYLVMMMMMERTLNNTSKKKQILWTNKRTRGFLLRLRKPPLTGAWLDKEVFLCVLQRWGGSWRTSGTNLCASPLGNENESALKLQ